MQGTATVSAPTLKTPSQRDYDDTFTKAYETYYTKVFAFVYSRVPDVESARDVVSSVFERAYRKGGGVRDQGAYAGWLFMIAKNQIAAHYRQAKRNYAGIERAGGELRFVDGPLDPEGAVLRDERVGLLLDQMRTLAQRDQELLSLKFDAELTNAEIGQVVGMSALNVRVSIFRALRRLKEKMERAAGEYRAA